MIPPQIEKAASHNLATTYFRLGATMPNAKIWRDEGFTVCTGDVDHPLCNFAAELDIDPWSARRLRDLAASRKAFHVYVTPGDRPEHLDELLDRAELVNRYRLHMMAAPPIDPESVEDLLELEEATDPQARAWLATFMADSFFSRQTRDLRQAIAGATAQGEGLRLFWTGKGRHIHGATMLCESPGVIGLYNLCVAPPQQRRGLATAILEAVRGAAFASDRHVVLQCDERLVNFYADRGFQPIGLVSVYTAI